jgi:quinol monooxygenase YgiN
MLVRIWRVKIKPERMEDLKNFARTFSLPMFTQQAGCLGVLFSLDGNNCATITFWDTIESIERLGNSRSYRETVDKIEASGMLEGEHKVEVFQIFDGYLNQSLMKGDPHEKH